MLKFYGRAAGDYLKFRSAHVFVAPRSRAKTRQQHHPEEEVHHDATVELPPPFTLFANCGNSWRVSSGLLRLGLCSGDYPGRAGFWQRQSAVPSRALTCLSLST